MIPKDTVILCDSPSLNRAITKRPQRSTSCSPDGLWSPIAFRGSTKCVNNFSATLLKQIFKLKALLIRVRWLTMHPGRIARSRSGESMSHWSNKCHPSELPTSKGHKSTNERQQSGVWQRLTEIQPFNLYPSAYKFRKLGLGHWSKPCTLTTVHRDDEGPTYCSRRS